MRKYNWLLTVLLIIVLCMTCGCGTDSAVKSMIESDNIKIIDGYRCYDTNTGIVYICFEQRNITGHRGYGFMSPYISENGLFCRYEDGLIVEIEEVPISSGLQSIGMGLYYSTETSLVYKETGIDGFTLYRDKGGFAYKYDNGIMTPYEVIETNN